MKIRLLTDVTFYRTHARQARPLSPSVLERGRTFDGATLQADGSLEVLDNVQLGVPFHLLPGEWQQVATQRQLADWERE